MSSTADSLLAQIEAGVLDSSVPLSSLLQNVIVLGGKAGSEKMREWARHELNGYLDGIDVPRYRQLAVPVFARITNRSGYNGLTQRIPASMLPKAINDAVDIERLNLGTGIGEIEALIAEAEKGGEPTRMSPPFGDVLAEYLNENGVDAVSRVAMVYWDVPLSTLQGVLVKVRTALAELVAELAVLTPEGQETPTKAAADQAMQLVFTGDPTVYVTHQQTDSGTNIAAPGAESATVASGSTAVGSQTANGKDSTVVGAQVVHGNDATVTGRDSAPSAVPAETEGFWGRLRKRGLLVALFTVVGGIAGVLAWIGWKPW
ncbi:hypothetical protein E0H75_41410 [Kribbella capetownensis]|uniref:AbiTii domain-containing protein n=1 Tax=Kribbella capetownensis TaxID=1572659 RepID=A0A4R0IUV5_9ACTN|nr:hypothetical protein [Kribbella capetownensis]TCC35248.1 hypothetical protein E0H75_41410 [Kribbella capetownensis]